MKNYLKTRHTVYHHRYHIVWITKYRYKVLNHEIKKRVRDIVAGVAEEMGINIENGVVSWEHVHLFVAIPPHIAVSEFVRMAKGRSSRKVQQEFPSLKKVYWGKHFWGRGFFSATSGNVTDDIINEYINRHGEANDPENSKRIRVE